MNINKHKKQGSSIYVNDSCNSSCINVSYDYHYHFEGRICLSCVHHRKDQASNDLKAKGYP